MSTHHANERQTTKINAQGRDGSEIHFDEKKLGQYF